MQLLLGNMRARVGACQARPGWAAALMCIISICVGQIWEQAELAQATAPTGTHMSLDRVWRYLAGLGCNTHQHVQDPWLGMGLVGELWGLLC